MDRLERVPSGEESLGWLCIRRAEAQKVSATLSSGSPSKREDEAIAEPTNQRKECTGRGGWGGTRCYRLRNRMMSIYEGFKKANETEWTSKCFLESFTQDHILISNTVETQREELQMQTTLSPPSLCSSLVWADLTSRLEHLQGRRWVQLLQSSWEAVPGFPAKSDKQIDLTSCMEQTVPGS